MILNKKYLYNLYENNYKPLNFNAYKKTKLDVCKQTFLKTAASKITHF